MAGKSIEDILRQQAAQRQTQIQQQQAKERALNEQRERARQDYLERMRMFEKLSNTNPAAAAAAAGGRAKKPVVNGHAEIILFSTSDSDNWQYVILDYLAETISKTKDTGVDKNEGNSIYIIENTGFIINFNSVILFINDNAEIIDTISSSDQYTSFYGRNYYYSYLNDGTIKYFNGKKVTSYSGLPDPSNLNDTGRTKNSIVFTTNISSTTDIYVWNPTIGLVSVWSGLTSLYNGINYNDNADFFSVSENTVSGWTKINIYGDDGSTKSYLDVTALSPGQGLASGYLTFFGDNKLECKFFNQTPATNYFLNIYDGYTDTWRSSTHAKGSNYQYFNTLSQNQYDGSQYTSLSNGIFSLLHDGTTMSVYNIDLYRHLDVIWSIDGSTHSSYTVNNTTSSTKGVDINDAEVDGFNNTALNLGKSIFLPMWLNDSTFRLLCLTSTQSVNIAVGTSTGLNGTQGDSDLIPNWRPNQKYVSFRVGDNFGVWLAYASADVYKIYNEVGTNVISLTMSVGTRLNYTGGVAVVTDGSVEYVFNSSSLGASPSYATYSAVVMEIAPHYGLKPDFIDDDKTPSLMLNLNEGTINPSRIYTDEDVFEFTCQELIFNYWLSDQYIVLEGRDNPTYTLFFYDWTGTLLASVNTGVSTSLSYDADLIKDRVYFRVVDGSTTTYYYFSPTKSDSFSVENESSSHVQYDYWSWKYNS